MKKPIRTQKSWIGRKIEIEKEDYCADAFSVLRDLMRAALLGL